MERRQSTLEILVMDPTFWKNKSVFLTGHTGFKGGWIAHWLSDLGAQVHGYGLEPTTEPNFFIEAKLFECLETSSIGDIRDLNQLKTAITRAKPDVVIHMAAQPLVRDSYNRPVETFSTNVIGTANLLEAVRHAETVKSVVNITTDKCYENKEWLWAYRESDRLGGYDPYSASKACAELVAMAYRSSFLRDRGVHLASVRAGNVIGGGDWSADRLIPDFLRALDAGQTLKIRSPAAVRPWQHVLEPLSGYLLLAQKLFEGGKGFAEAWNFGPEEADAKSVAWIVEQLCGRVPGAKWESESATQPHEAGLLKVDSSKAKARLGWAPRWDLQTTLNKTMEWHQAWRDGEDMQSVTRNQIRGYAEV